MHDIALYLALALLANYPEFPDSCFLLKFAFQVHVLNVLIDSPEIFAKKLGHLRL